MSKDGDWCRSRIVGVSWCPRHSGLQLVPLQHNDVLLLLQRPEGADRVRASETDRSTGRRGKDTVVAHWRNIRKEGGHVASASRFILATVFRGRACICGAEGLVVCLLPVVAASCQGSSGRERRPGESRASGRRGLEPALAHSKWMVTGAREPLIHWSKHP